MRAGRLEVLGAVVSLMTVTACSSSQETTPDSLKADIAQPAVDTRSQQARWVNRTWKVTAPADRAPGSFYIFLSNGTLVMTSCVETYRLATWREEAGGTITITEDPITHYGAAITEVADRQLRLRLTLRTEQVDLMLQEADVPYVCPDLRR